MQFQRSIERWIREEEEKARRNSRNSPLNMDTTDIDDILDSNIEDIELLDYVKKELVKDFGAQDALDSIVFGVQRSSNLALSASENMSSKMGSLVNLLKNTPEYKPDKSSIDRAIQNHRLSSQPLNTNLDAVRKKLANILDDESVDDFLSNNNILIFDGSTQQVNELGDRFYSISTSNSEPALLPSDIASIKIINPSTGEEFEEISGVDSARLDGNRIIIRTKDDPEFVLSLQIETVSEKKARGKSNRRSLKDDVKDVADDLQFEAWACIVSDVADWIYFAWKNLKADLEESFRMINVLKKMYDNKLLTFQITAKPLRYLAAMKYALNEILSPSAIAAQFLGVQTNLSMIQLSRSAAGLPTMCDFNKKQYCGITLNLEKLLDEVNIFDFNLPFDTIQIDLGDILLEFSEFFSEILKLLELIDKEVEKISKEVCVFIMRRMKGSPKSLTKSQELMGKLGYTLAAFPILMAGDSKTFKLSKILKKAGLDRASDMLARGDIEGFMKLNSRESTYAGEVAIELDRKSRESYDSGQSYEYKRMSRSAAVFADQKLLSQKIRDKARSRMTQNRGLYTAKKIRNKGIDIS